jgi:hypothetical protein
MNDQDLWMERCLRRWKSETDKKRVRKAIEERFFEIVGADPMILLREALAGQRRGEEPTAVEDALMKWHTRLVGMGAESSAGFWYSVMRGFFTANRLSLPKPPRGVSVTSTYEGTFSPPQERVKEMVRSRTDPRDRAVIAFLAQTGQTVGTLLVMKNLVAMKKHDMMREVDSRGIITITNAEVARRPHPYAFVVGKDAMSLLRELPSYDDGSLFGVSERTVTRIVDSAAEAADIQKRVPTKVGHHWSRMHANTFRRYWKERMIRGGVFNDTLLRYMMGYRIKGITTYWGYLTDETILDEYKRAEHELEVL